MMLYRAIIAAIALYLSYWSIRMAIADTAAKHNNLESAIALEPQDSVLKARRALQRNATGDTSPQADEELKEAARLDPLNAELPIALGLREEFRGHLPEAAKDLVHAAELDHRFKPAWTLASFYVRNDEPEKASPVIRRALNLNPLAYDPAPVFDLCWNMTTDSRRILDLIPTRGAVPLQYLYYLMARKRFDAAMEVWPRALDAVPPTDAGFIEAMNAVPEYLIQAGRISDAVSVWNKLVERGIVRSGKLAPAQGAAIADPDFSFPQTERGFGWRVMQGAIRMAPGIRFEFDGEEPENIVLLSTTAALVPGNTYRVVWKADASQLSSPKDPGFVLELAQSTCEPLVQKCEFTSDAQSAPLALIYKRASGTTKARGVLQVDAVKLELTKQPLASGSAGDLRSDSVARFEHTVAPAKEKVKQ